MAENSIYYGDNLPILQSLPDASVDLIYIDPPFNTGKTQGRMQIKTEQSANGSRAGCAGRRYKFIRMGNDTFRIFLKIINFTNSVFNGESTL